MTLFIRWLTGLVTKQSGATSILSGSYTRDEVGHIKSITGLTTADSWTYGYDLRDRLIQANNGGVTALSETFSYAANNNMVSRSRVTGNYLYPAATAARPHAATTINGLPVTYDANGNTLTDGTRAFTWDGRI